MMTLQNGRNIHRCLEISHFTGLPVSTGFSTVRHRPQSAENSLLWQKSGSKNPAPAALTSKLPPGIDLEPRLDRAGAAQNPRRQEKERGEQGKYTMDCDADDAEGQRNQPNDGKQNDGQQSQRPAEDKQNAPEKERGHVEPP